MPDDTPILLTRPVADAIGAQRRSCITDLDAALDRIKTAEMAGIIAALAEYVKTPAFSEILNRRVGAVRETARANARNVTDPILLAALASTIEYLVLVEATTSGLHDRRERGG